MYKKFAVKPNKMTNKEDDGGEPRDPRVAAFLAVHLVSQVLEEAYNIASVANESDEPWNYLSLLKNLRNSEISEIDAEEEVFGSSKGNGDDTNVQNKDIDMNSVVTSTPQKSGQMKRSKSEISLIGQGDEECVARQNELTKSTSMFINHLFDMSDVERVIICDDTEIIQSDTEPNDLLAQAMTNIMESYINSALGVAFLEDVDLSKQQTPAEDSLCVAQNSCFSFLGDGFTTNVVEEVAFYIDDDAPDDKESEKIQVTAVVEMTEQIDQVVEVQNDNNNYVEFCEKAYLTLNRDYEQYSEEESEPILQDPKGMTLQEVELMTASTSEENITPPSQTTKECKELAATSVISTSAASRKSSLVQRCRTQGARLLACLRGWWRRKTPGKRKEARVPGAARGLCPLSPDARRRAASLLDQRHLRSPSPSRNIAWKFNTVNETLVNSSRWNEYVFEVKPEECGEY